jgi:hypothetical protein
VFLGASLHRRAKSWLIRGRRPRRDILELCNGLLAPLRCIPRRPPISNVKTCKIVVQRHVPGYMAPAVTRAGNWRCRAHRRLIIIVPRPKPVAWRVSVVTINLHWARLAGRGSQRSLLRDNLIEALNSRKSGRIIRLVAVVTSSRWLDGVGRMELAQTTGSWPAKCRVR